MRELMPSITTDQRAANTESLFDNCIVIDWYYCVQYGSYPEQCFYDYTSMECYIGLGTPSVNNPSGWTGPSPGGTPGTISGGSNSYPIAKLNQLIRFDTSIKTTLLSPCVRTVMMELKDNPNGAGFWGKVIYDIFKTIPNFKWTLQMGTLPANVNARTNVTDPLTGAVTTTINTIYANSCTNNSMARTLLHESVHAFLAIWWRRQNATVTKTFPEMYQDYVNSNSNELYASHEEMTRSFVDHMAYNLQSYGNSRGYNLSNQYYYDMVLGGLLGTTYFNELDPLTQQRITAIQQAEATNQSVLTPSNIIVSPQGDIVCPL